MAISSCNSCKHCSIALEPHRGTSRKLNDSKYFIASARQPVAMTALYLTVTPVFMDSTVHPRALRVDGQRLRSEMLSSVQLASKALFARSTRLGVAPNFCSSVQRSIEPGNELPRA